MSSIYEISALNIEKQQVPFSNFKGKVLLVVNVASKCGFTPQYAELEELYKKYRAQGLELLAFPCNQFGSQEPGSEDEIKNFCKLTYDTSFPLFQKIDVNGKEAHPLYEWLKTKAPGILGTKAIKWNFTKFLVSKDGSKVQRFAPNTKPSELFKEVEELLKSHLKV